MGKKSARKSRSNTKEIFMQGSNNVLLKLDKVEKDFRRGSETIKVLQGIDLNIQGGDFVSLMGPSGSGKTTLLNLIGGLDRPTRGSVEVGGDRLDGLSERALAAWRARHVGFV